VRGGMATLCMAPLGGKGIKLERVERRVLVGLKAGW
jgi:hypothetical protein